HGDRVGFLAGRASRRPHAQARPAPGQHVEIWAQRIPRFDVAEELRDVDRERVEQLLILVRVAVEEGAVVLVRMYAAGAHAHRDPALQALVLVRPAADSPLA